MGLWDSLILGWIYPFAIFTLLEVGIYSKVTGQIDTPLRAPDPSAIVGAASASPAGVALGEHKGFAFP
jgi:hypothetical protein